MGMPLALVFAIICFFAWATMAFAQEPLPADLAYYIENAARNKSRPNDVLLLTVANAIAANPAYVELIMAKAVTMAPQERNTLVNMTITSFPYLANRILIGASMAAPLHGAPPGYAAPVYAPPAYAPPAYAPPVYAAPVYAPPAYAPPAYAAPAYAPPAASQMAARMAPGPAPLAPPVPMPSNSNIDLTRKLGGYVAFGAGYKLLRDSNLENAGGTPSGSLNMKNGFAGILATGRRWPIGLRGELEANYHRNAIDQLNGPGFGYTAANKVSGRMTTYAIMANGYYDFSLDLLDGRLTPYVGGGIGYSRVKLDFDGATTSQMDDVYAYQAMTGAEYILWPGMALKGEYRYFATKDPDFGRTTASHKSHVLGIGAIFDF